MSIKIDTSRVFSTANRIENYNNLIDNEFSYLQSEMRNLKSYWKSDAAYIGFDRFSTFEDKQSSRSAVIKDLVRFMKTIISNDYEEIERKIVTSASLFK